MIQVIALILIVAAWYIGYHMAESNGNMVIGYRDAEIKRLNNLLDGWNEHSVESEKQLRQMYTQLSQYEEWIKEHPIPDIIGMNVTEPEQVPDRETMEYWRGIKYTDVDIVKMYGNGDKPVGYVWNDHKSDSVPVYKRPEMTNPIWDKRPETNPYKVTDIRYAQWDRKCMKADHKLSSEELYEDRRVAGAGC